MIEHLVLVGQVVNLRRIVNPPAAGPDESLRHRLQVGRRIANPPQIAKQIANLPHKS
jgi:hypothetical protein